KNIITAGHGQLHAQAITDVRLEEANRPPGHSRGQVVAAAAYQVVQDANFASAFLHHAIDDVGADQTRSPCHQDRRSFESVTNLHPPWCKASSRARITASCWRSVISGKSGSVRHSRPMRSATGKSPTR